MRVETYVREDVNIDVLRVYTPGVAKEGPLMVFIPGNPGLIGFYREFLKGIHRKNPDWEIVGISHTGMCSADTEKDEIVHSLEDQIAHKIKVINELLNDECIGDDKRKTSRRRLKLFGHSIGAYMVQRIAVSTELMGKVETVGLLTPTIIDIHRSPKGIRFKRVIDWVPQLYDYIGRLDNVLFNWLFPTALTGWFIRWLYGTSDECVINAVSKLVTTPTYVRQSLGLAQIEMKQVRDQWGFQDEFILFCQENVIDIWFLFSVTDYWIHADTMKDIVELYEKKYTDLKYRHLLKISIDDAITHSFVINDTTEVVDKYF